MQYPNIDVISKISAFLAKCQINGRTIPTLHPIQHHHPTDHITSRKLNSMTRAALLLVALALVAVAQTRNFKKQPFAAYSIWNLPRGVVRNSFFLQNYFEKKTLTQHGSRLQDSCSRPSKAFQLRNDERRGFHIYGFQRPSTQHYAQHRQVTHVWPTCRETLTRAVRRMERQIEMRRPRRRR